MRDFLLSLIGIALLEVLLSAFAGSESMKKTSHLLCGTAMAVLVISRVIGFDYADYAAALSRTDAQELWSSESAAETGRQLNRRLIEDRCRAYILDKADSIGVPLCDAAVLLTWSTEGYWYPTGAVLTVPEQQGSSAAVEEILESDLGIAPEKVEWRCAG